MKRTPRADFKVFFTMIAVLVVPATLTLLTVKRPGSLILPSPNPTPLGYTWSLLLFIVPVIVIAVWFHLKTRRSLQQKAFWLTLAVLLPLGFLLDVVFGKLFFTFPNSAATLGMYLPGYDIEKGCWLLDLPIEEFIFYASGFCAVLLIYIWCDEYWCGAYNVPDYFAETKGIAKIASFHLKSVITGVALIVAAFLYKRFFPHHYQDGIPGYFIFLVVTSIVPSGIFFRTVQPFVNWRAFSFTFFFVLLVSLLWEATLAGPYGWWGYNYRQMMGITIGAWSRLPIEAVIVWMAVTFTTVICYEAVKIFLAMGRPFRKAMFGMKYNVPQKLGSEIR